MLNEKRIYILLVLSLIIFTAVYIWSEFYSSTDYWKQSIPSIGSSSSPRLVDLNNDGVLDIVMGGGGREFTETDFGVFALDGSDGTLLWNVPARNQVIGSPIFKDINNDNYPDIIIGGRSAILYAINGISGDIIWEYLPSYDSMDIISDTTLLNFYNPQFIPDQDRDGLDDILIAYGGFMQAEPDESDRPSGSLKVVSSKDGTLLAKAKMPDGKETYMSALVHDFEQNGELSVIFGTGGETIHGNLYKVDLESVIEEDISQAEVIADGNGKGFISPPVLVDVNDDNIQDIVVSSVNGEIFCFDGETFNILWHTKLEGEFEGYAMPAPGSFNEDTVPDLFISYGHGIWPDVDFTYQIALNGQDGSIIFKDTLGNFQYASPLTFDFTEDGYDDVLVVVNNISNFKGAYTSIKSYSNDLTVFDIQNKIKLLLHDTKSGSNLGSTPVLADLDNDSYLDIIYVYMNDPWNFYSFNEAIIERIATDFEINQPVRWGEYMGKNHNGIFEK